MRTESLKDITTKIGSGATPTGGERSYKSEGISLIRSQNVLDFTFSKNGLAFIDDDQAKALDNVTVEENDILLNITGDSIARCCIVPKEVLPARVNQHVSIIRCDSTVNSNYVFYYLEFLKPYLLKICGVGGTRNALTKEVIEKLQIAIPENQDKIADILSSLDAKISLNTRINTELEQLAKTLYDYWFVQFDFPISATQAAAMGKPPLEGKPYRSSGGAMVWNEELKREVPRGWKVGGFNNLIDEFISGDWGKDSEKGANTEKVMCIRGADIANLTSEKLTEAPIRFISKGNADKVLVANTLIVEISGGSPTQSTGRIAYLNEALLNRLGHAIICSNFCRAISLKDGAYLYFFFLTWKLLYEAKVLFNYEGKTTGLKNLLIDDFIDDYKILVPDSYFIKKFNNLVLPYFTKIQKNAEENQLLTSLRDFLLPLLMSGEVSISIK